MVGRIVCGLVGVLLVASSCLPEDGADTDGNIIDAPAALEEVASVVAPSRKAGHVASCVSQAEFGTFAGDTYWTDQWNAAGASQSGMQAVCETYDAATLSAIHDEWVAFEAFVAAAEAEAGVAPPPSPECDPAYPDICIPPGSPDLNCRDIPHENFTVLEPDPHGFDGNDRNGIGCER